MTISPLHRAVAIVGGQTALARALSTAERPIAQGHIWAWLYRTKVTPPEFCIHIEQATGGAVTRYDLRPDIFGPAPSEQDKTEAAA